MHTQRLCVSVDQIRCISRSLGTLALWPNVTGSSPAITSYSPALTGYSPPVTSYRPNVTSYSPAITTFSVATAPSPKMLSLHFSKKMSLDKQGKRSL